MIHWLVRVSPCGPNNKQRAIILMWFSVLLVLVSVSVLSHLLCVRMIFSWVKVAEWPPFGEYLLIRLTIRSLDLNLSICSFGCFPSRF